MVENEKWIRYGVVALVTLGLVRGASADPTSNAALVRTAMTELFVNRDGSAVERYWGKNYVQHNPSIGNGSEELPNIVKSLPLNFKYEPGMIAAQGDIVMIHGRYTGWGPKPIIAVDIFRVENGKLAEHWDVLQDEVPAERTKSGNPMFSPGR